jgi:hypothetical protein
MRSDEAFRVANKVAAPFSLVCGLLLLVTGGVELVLPARDVSAVVLPGVLIVAATLSLYRRH